MMREGAPAIHGLDSIIAFFKKNKGIPKLDLQTEFIDVGLGGDLGYTFGNWKMEIKSEKGKQKSIEGTHVTIWRLQSDNSWKYVFTSWVSNKPKEKPAENPPYNPEPKAINLN
jgi:ketosteroid isomerase-like protein